MSSAGREMEPWRLPVQALRALERQLRVQPEVFGLALAAEKILEKISPDVSALDAAPLSGLAGAAERAVNPSKSAASDVQRPKRAPAAMEPIRAGADAPGGTKGFAGGSSLIGAALERGRAMHAGGQEGARSRRSGSGADRDGLQTGAMEKRSRTLADGGVTPIPLDPARRGKSGSSDGDTPPVGNAFVAAASAAMEALERAKEDDVTLTAPDGNARSTRREDPLAPGVEAIRRAGRLADGLMGPGPVGEGRDTRGRDSRAEGVAPESATISQVNRLATALLARSTRAGEVRKTGEGAPPGSNAGDVEGSAQVTGAAPPTAAPPVRASRMSDGPAAAPSGARGSIVQPTGTGARGSPQLPDAPTIATLVNDVLMEQARRHGVDLT